MPDEIVMDTRPGYEWRIARCSHPAPTDPCRQCDVQSRANWMQEAAK